MLTIIFCWVVLFLVIFLIGRLFLSHKLLEFLHLKGGGEWYEYFWVGLVIVFCILQIWSIFFPVNIYSLIFIFSLALISAVINRKDIFKIPKLNKGFILVSIPVLLVISYFASLPVDVYDTYLYHLVAVKWSNSFSVVRGLANLFWCMGTNSSFFLFASMIDNWFLKDRSSHIALSLMVSVISIEFIWILFKSKEESIKWFIAFAIPLIAISVMKKTVVVSLSTDLALAIFVLAICIEIVKNNSRSLFIAALLSITMLTIKLSGIVFGGGILLFILYKYFKLNGGKLLKPILYLVAAGTIIILPYIVRNIFLSGWPLFPLPAFGLNVAWAMPLPAVQHSYEVLRAFSIWSGPEWTEFTDLSIWQWFPDWFTRNLQNPTLKVFILSCSLFLISLFFKVFTKERCKENTNLLALGTVSFLNIIYILIKSPDLRYAEIFVWIFFAAIMTMFTMFILEKRQEMKKVFIMLAVSISLVLVWPIRNGGSPLLKSMRWVPQPSTEEIMIKPIDGSPAFRVYKPLGGSDQCGNADLPCTPWPSNNFKEIVPGDISKGFAATD